MKSLKDHIKECNATPMNTLGIGNVAFPTDTTVGSGDTFQFRKIRRNKKLRLRKNIKSKI